MATYNDGGGYHRYRCRVRCCRPNSIRCICNTKLATITTECAAAGLTALAATDVEVIKVPANTLVTNVALNVTTAEGGTLTIDVGDGIDPDDFDGVNANATAAYLCCWHSCLRAR